MLISGAGSAGAPVAGSGPGESLPMSAGSILLRGFRRTGDMVKLRERGDRRGVTWPPSSPS